MTTVAAASDSAATGVALVELVGDGLLTWSAAAMMYREEFNASYADCARCGLIERLQNADKQWREKVLLVKAGLRTLAHTT